MKGGPYKTGGPYRKPKLVVVLAMQRGHPYKTNMLSLINNKTKVVLTTQISGPYRRNSCSYISDGSNCAAH